MSEISFSTYFILKMRSREIKNPILVIILSAKAIP